MVRGNRGISGILVMIVLVIVAVAIVVAIFVPMYTNTYKISGIVTKMWIDPVEGGSAYLVRINVDSTNETKMLEVQKNIFFNHINEDLVYAQLEVGKHYDFTCWGWDLPYFWIFATYWYPNIIEVNQT
jgi:hypothetical protein